MVIAYGFQSMYFGNVLSEEPSGAVGRILLGIVHDLVVRISR